LSRPPCNPPLVQRTTGAQSPPARSQASLVGSGPALRFPPKENGRRP